MDSEENKYKNGGRVAAKRQWVVVMQIVCSWGITLLLSGTSQFCAAAYTTRREQPKKNRMLKSM